MTAFADFTTDWLLRCTIEGSLLIALVLGMRRVFGRTLGPRWRVALWTLVGVKLLLPASLSFLPGIGTLAVPSAAPEIVAAPELAAVEQPTAIVLNTVETTVATSAPLSVLSSAPTLSLADIAIGVWLVGVLVFIAAATIRQWKFTRQISRRRCEDRELLKIVRKVARECGMRSGVRVYLDGAGTTPAVFGVFQPSLLLPEDWAEQFDDASLRHVLLHELEHVRVGDVGWNWVATLLNALHWFNPLAWIANSNFQSDRELRCDAGTLSRLTPDDRLAYGHTLLNIQQNNHAAPAIAGLAPCVRNHPTLRQRLAMITQPDSRKTWLNCIFAAAAAGLICLSFGAAQADDERRGREGDAPREGARDGDRPREGARDGDKPREGARDGDRPREGARDGDRPREGARDGDMRRDGKGETDRPGQVHLRVDRDGVVLGDTKYKSMDQFRAAFKKTNAKSVVISSQPQLPVATLNAVMNAISDMGITDVSLKSVAPLGSARRDGDRDGDRPREGARDGDRPREGSRDGDRPREGARDGDRPREGARDGDRPREGARDGDRPREGARDGDRPREGARDGDRPREGARDGDRPREGARDGDRPREGARDGDRPREGSRDGDRPREGEREGARDDDRPREGEREGARDGDRPREGEREGAHDGDRPREGEREGAHDGDRPREGEREGARDGDRPREGEREGARDGDRPREGEREGAHDGDRPREGEREGARDSANSETSDREIQQLERIYKAYDKDANNKVSFDEWLAMKSGEMTSDREKRERGWFDQADSNEDESLTIEEWKTWKLSQGR